MGFGCALIMSLAVIWAASMISHFRSRQQRAVDKLKADHMTLGQISQKFAMPYDLCKLVMERPDITVNSGGNRVAKLYRRDRVLKVFDPRGKREQS
jgi:ribosomal protein L32